MRFVIQRVKNASVEVDNKVVGAIDKGFLVVMADHGNDPKIGSSRHTRECVPLLIKHKDVKGINVGIRKSLSRIHIFVKDLLNW